MNLYTPLKHTREKARHVNPHTIYLSNLVKENPNIDIDFKLITTLSNDDKKLYVLSNTGKYYLADSFILGAGIANILYSSHSSARTIKFGNKLLGVKTLS